MSEEMSSQSLNVATPDTSDLVLRDYSSGDPIQEITRLVHEAYAGLERLGFHYVASHQSDAITARRLGRGFPIVAFWCGRLVGTATLYPPRPVSPVPWYRRPEVCYFGQFAVRPELQRRGIGARLMRELEARARARGASELACDTAEGAEHLRAWYAREGFRFIEYTSWPDTNYRSVVLSKTLGSA